MFPEKKSSTSTLIHARSHSRWRVHLARSPKSAWGTWRWAALHSKKKIRFHHPRFQGSSALTFSLHAHASIVSPPWTSASSPLSVLATVSLKYPRALQPRVTQAFGQEGSLRLPLFMRGPEGAPPTPGTSTPGAAAQGRLPKMAFLRVVRGTHYF